MKQSYNWSKLLCGAKICFCIVVSNSIIMISEQVRFSLFDKILYRHLFFFFFCDTKKNITYTHAISMDTFALFSSSSSLFPTQRNITYTHAISMDTFALFSSSSSLFSTQRNIIYAPAISMDTFALFSSSSSLSSTQRNITHSQNLYRRFYIFLLVVDASSVSSSMQRSIACSYTIEFERH